MVFFIRKKSSPKEHAALPRLLHEQILQGCYRNQDSVSTTLYPAQLSIELIESYGPQKHFSIPLRVPPAWKKVKVVSDRPGFSSVQLSDLDECVLSALDEPTLFLQSGY